ncbi:MAG: cytochrome c, partial [Verrucomicrobiota bacterium]
QIHEAIRREKSEPDEGSESFPVFGMVYIVAILAGGLIYLGMFSGGFNGDVYDERPGAGYISQNDEGVEAPEDPAAKLLKLGKRTYTTYCQSCHQGSGMGVAGVYPPLSGSEWVLDTTIRPTLIVLNGLQGPIQVKGNTYNQVMAQWGSALSDKEIAAVVSYIRNEWGNQATTIDADYVANIRDSYSSKSGAWSAEELLEISE